MTPKFSVYLAGPDVFSPDVHHRLHTKELICEQLRLIPLNPVDNDALPDATPQGQALAIYRGNLAKMEQAHAILANITPFRGPHMDPGTAFEIGFFVARGKPVVCYSESIEDLADRVLAWSNQGRTHAAQELRDRDGALIEDFQLKENLMIESAMAHQRLETLGHGVPASSVLMCFDDFTEAAKSLATYFYGLT
jgi:nucleoside 2-deoxyribosyltransferase